MTPEEKTLLIDTARKLDEFLSIYNRYNNATSTTFTKKIYFQGGADLSQGEISLGGSSSTIGLYGATPVVRASAISNPLVPSAVYDQSEAQSVVNALNLALAAIRNIGIIH